LWHLQHMKRKIQRRLARAHRRKVIIIFSIIYMRAWLRNFRLLLTLLFISRSYSVYSSNFGLFDSKGNTILDAPSSTNWTLLF